MYSLYFFPALNYLNTVSVEVEHVVDNRLIFSGLHLNTVSVEVELYPPVYAVVSYNI